MSYSNTFRSRYFFINNLAKFTFTLPLSKQNLKLLNFIILSISKLTMNRLFNVIDFLSEINENFYVVRNFYFISNDFNK